MPTHKKPESERFKGPAKWCQYVVARTVVSLLQRLPIRFAFRLGRGIGWLCWKLLTRRRAVVRKNLEIVNAWMDAQRADGGSMMNDGGESSELESVRRKKNAHPSLSATEDTNPSSFISYHSSLALPLEAQVKEVFQRSGANLFSGFTFNRMSPEQAAQHIQIEGIEHLKAALNKGRGVIVLLAHMGPWEALTQLPALARKYDIDAPFGAIYRTLNNHYLDEWYKSQREAKGTRMFPSRYKFYAPVDFLRSGGMLGVISDQRASGGEDVLFFGKKTRGTPLPGLLSKRADCPMFAVAIKTERPMRWLIRVEPVELPVDGERNRQILANAVAQAVESSLLQSVEDGFWFHRRFR